MRSRVQLSRSLRLAHRGEGAGYRAASQERKRARQLPETNPGRPISGISSDLSRKSRAPRFGIVFVGAGLVLLVVLLGIWMLPRGRTAGIRWFVKSTNRAPQLML